MLIRTATLLMLCLVLAACRDEEPAPRERVVARSEPSRRACIAGLLASRAEDDLATLASSLPSDAAEGDAMAAVRRQAGRAAQEYARAFYQFASLRASAAAYTDSALTHATNPADSARYAEAAAGFRIRAPERGTVEGNVAEAYARDFGAVWNDADHPCNWAVTE